MSKGIFTHARDESFFQFVISVKSVARKHDGVNGVGYSVCCVFCIVFCCKVGGVKLIHFQINNVKELNGWTLLRGAPIKKKNMLGIYRGVGGD